MIIPGRVALERKIITHVISPQHQVQPCGIDLTLQKVKQWTSPGAIDFDNTRRRRANTTPIEFSDGLKSGSGVAKPSLSINNSSKQLSASKIDAVRGHIDLGPGSYLVEFNELVDMPLDLMGQIFVRSSLFRSGALISAGVMDSGYQGHVGAMLQVVNPHGLQLFANAKLAQIVFHQMSEPVEGYNGMYQGSTSV